MLQRFLLLPLLFSTAALDAQPCSVANSQYELHANDIGARILNNGRLFDSYTDGGFFPYPVAGQQVPGTIAQAGLWIGGVDPGGNLKIAAMRPSFGSNSEYWPGPLDALGTTSADNCSNWDFIFSVRGDQIATFLADLPISPNAAIAQYPAIMGWPGAGNPFFEQIHGFALPPVLPFRLAPFYDADGNNVYNPLQGDYPAISLQGGPIDFVPTELTWCIFNDEGSGSTHGITHGNALQVEVQLLAWAIDCPNESVLDRTIFTRHTITNRSTERIDSCFVGLWVDFNIGCGKDDYIGCDPALNTFYGYNQDSMDNINPGENCIVTFGENPPVQSVTFLDGTLDNFVYYSNPSLIGAPPAGATDPDQPAEYYNYLTGRWRDGTPISNAGSGYQQGGQETHYAFSGDPADPAGWSMCSANLPYAQQRTLGSHKFTAILPGASRELTVAWTAHFDADLPCDLGATKNEIAHVRNLYGNGFADICAPLATQAASASALKMFPNPADQLVTVQLGDQTFRSLRLLCADGRQVQGNYRLEAGQLEIETSRLPAGVYFARIATAEGLLAGKFVVLR